MNPDFPLSRRGFLGAAAGLCLSGGPPTLLQRRGRVIGDARAANRRRDRTRPTKKLAVVTTAYYYLSHAYHVCGRFLNGYLRDGKMHYPDFGIAGMYVEQTGPNDLSKEHARKHGFPLYPDIAAALTLGGDKLAVDGVLLIGEHGDYPFNDKLQKLYPRYEFFQKIVEVFRKSGRTRAGLLRQAPVVRPQEGAGDGGDGPQGRLPADGRVEPAGDLAAAGVGIAARRAASRRRWSRRAARWRFSAFTPWKRCNAWWNGGRRRSRASRR